MTQYSIHILVLASLSMLSATVLRADQRLEGIACRSVHLAYPAPENIAFYNEIQVTRSAPGTYFCVCGFSKGYYGLQELANGKKLLIFSVWDPGRQNDPRVVEKDRRVQLLYRDAQVRVGRFGNEGTGGQSFFDYDWKIGERYRLLVTAAVADQRTEYTAYFFVPEDHHWRRLVTFSTLADRHRLLGHYSFVEDFRRNRISATQARRATFGNGWIKATDGPWSPLATARFTADSNPATNIDAGADGGRFFLATGGDTENTTTPLRQTIQSEHPTVSPPADLLQLLEHPD